MLEVNKIYNCSFEEVIGDIPGGSIDMILTDIPYMLTKVTNLKKIKDYSTKQKKSQWENPNDLKWDKIFNLDKYLKECCRILKKSGVIIVWASWQQLSGVDQILLKYLKQEKGEPRIGIWKKSNPCVFNMDKMAIQPFELFVWNRKGSNCTFNNLNGYYIDNKNEFRQHPEIHFYEIAAPSKKKNEKKHPTSKPQQIFEWLICTYSNYGDTIFDGCVGGGTTAVAAYKNNRNFIAIEKEYEYCEIAQKRLVDCGLEGCIIKK